MKRTCPVEWNTTPPRLSVIAAWINANTTLFAEIEKGYCNTDRKIPGTRLRHPGKGRTGNRIKVFECEDHKRELILNPWHHFAREDTERERSRVYSRGPLLDHNAAETYRRNEEVVYWLRNYLLQNPRVVTTAKKK